MPSISSSQQQQSDSAIRPAKGRMALFDVVRGFSVISMVLFHLCYDLRYLYGFGLSFFQPPFQDIWRASISWTFLFVAGCMCSFSRNGTRRAARYLLAAAAIYVVTLIAAVDVPISFGIIFCMGASTLIDAALQRLGIAPKGWLVAAALFVCFLAVLDVPHGSVGIGSFSMALPRQLYATPYFSWLGFPGPGFASGDYYPVIPFTLMYLVGAAAGRAWSEGGFPEWFSKASCPPLEAVGRHALPIYLIHQPAIIAVLELIG